MTVNVLALKWNFSIKIRCIKFPDSVLKFLGRSKTMVQYVTMGMLAENMVVHPMSSHHTIPYCGLEIFRWLNILSVKFLPNFIFIAMTT